MQHQVIVWMTLLYHFKHGLAQNKSLLMKSFVQMQRLLLVLWLRLSNILNLHAGTVIEETRSDVNNEKNRRNC